MFRFESTAFLRKKTVRVFTVLRPNRVNATNVTKNDYITNTCFKPNIGVHVVRDELDVQKASVLVSRLFDIISGSGDGVQYVHKTEDFVPA